MPYIVNCPVVSVERLISGGNPVPTYVHTISGCMQDEVYVNIKVRSYGDPIMVVGSEVRVSFQVEYEQMTMKPKNERRK